MTKSKKSRAGLAAILAVAALASAAPAQAGNGGKHYECEGGVERLEAEFREIEEKRGYDAATKWWAKAWERYYESCVLPQAA